MFRFEKSVYPVGVSRLMFHSPPHKIISTLFFPKNGTLEHCNDFKDLPTTLLEQYSTIQYTTPLATIHHPQPPHTKIVTHG